MPKMSEAKWVGEHGLWPMKDYDIVCAHTIVGHDPAHAAHFSTGNDGLISQSRDTKFQSAANWQGNHRVIAIENEDTPPGWNNQLDFTEAQIESIAQIIVWCHETHGIPIVPCPDSKPGSRGIAYHRQGIDGNFGPYAYGGRVPGGERWSKSFGKMCPGDQRIKTLLEEIIPLAQKLARPPDLPPSLTDTGDMTMLVTHADTAVLLSGGKLVRVKSEADKVSLMASGIDHWKCSAEQMTALTKAYGAPVG